MKLRSTLLFAAASLTAPALLPVAATTAAAFFAAAVPASALNSATTEYNGTTYSGDIYNITNTENAGGLGSFTAEKYDSSTGTFSGTYGGSASYGNSGWLASASETSYVGNTLLLNTATSSDLTFTTDWSAYVWLGGLITAAGDYSYIFGRSATAMKLKGSAGVNMSIGADVTLLADTGISIESSGSWVVASGKTLTLSSTGGITISADVPIEISGGGSVVMGNIILSGGSGTITYDGSTDGAVTTNNNIITSGPTSFDFISVEEGSTLTIGTVTLAAGFTGTVKVKNLTNTLNLNSAMLGVAGSTLHLDNVSSTYLSNATFAANIDVGSGGFIINQGSSSSGGAGIFSGKITGAGTITFSKWNSTSSQYGGYKFTGDMTGFSGNISYGQANQLDFGNGAAYASSAAVDESGVISNIAGTGSIDSSEAKVNFNYAASDNYSVLAVGNSSISARTLEFAGGADYTVSSTLTGKDTTAANNTLTVSGGTATFTGTVSNFGTANVSGGTATFSGTVSNLTTLGVTNGGKAVFSGEDKTFSLTSLRIGAASDGIITFDGGLTKANTAFDEAAQATLNSILVNENGANVAVANNGYYYVGSGWTGTVELKNISSGSVNLANYGVSGSTLKIDAVTNAWLSGGTLGANIEIESGGLTVNNGASGNNSSAGIFSGKITGAGTITFRTWGNNGSQYGGYKFTGDMTGFTGSIAYNQLNQLDFGSGAAYASSATAENGVVGNIAGTGALSVSTSAALTFNYAASENYDVLALGNSSITSSGTVTFTGGATYLLDLGKTEYSAATTVSAGTLLIGGGADGAEKTLSSAVTVASGAGFGKSGSGTLTLAGDVTLSGGAILDLTSITLSEDEAAFKASGTVSFGTAETTTGEGEDAVTVTTKVTVALGGDSLLAGTYKVFDLGNTGLLEGWDALTKDDFTLGGNAITSSRVTITTNAQEGTFTVTGGVYSDMTWNGGASGTWDEATANWRSSQSGSEQNIAFASGDSVIFSTSGANVTLGSSISVNKVTVNADTTFTVPVAAEDETQLTLTANSIEISSGTLTLVGGLANYTWTAATVAEGATLDLGSGSAGISTGSITGTGTVKFVNSNTSNHDGIAMAIGTDFHGTFELSGNFNWNQWTLADDATIRFSNANYTDASMWAATTRTLSQTLEFTTDYKILLGNANLTLTGDVSVADDATLTVSGGNTLTLTGTFSGQLEQTAGTIILSGGTAEDDRSGDFSFSYLKVSSNFTLGENIALKLTSADIAGEFTVQSGAVLDLTGNSRTEDLSGNGKLIISGGTVKIADLGWGAGKNFGADFYYNRIQLSNGGVLEVTAAQPDGIGAGQRGFSVTNGEGTYRFTGEGMSYLVNNEGSQLISVADGATLVFDVTDVNSGITVSKLIARGTNAESGTYEISTGSLRKTGAGTLTLNGEGNYSGGTVIEEGTLIISNASAIGTGDVQVTNSDAVFTIVATATEGGISIANNISGNGQLTTEGDVILSGTLGVGDLSVGASVSLESENGKIAGTLAVAEEMATFTSAYDFSAGALSGSGTVAASGDEMRTATLTGTGSDSSFSGTIKNLNVTVASGTTTATFAGTTWTGANGGDSYTGTVKVVSGTAEFTGTQTGFAGTIELAGGEIKGTLNLQSGWTLTASAEAGAAKIENLTLAGGSTAEWTYLNDAVQAGAEAQSYAVSGVLNFTGTENNAVTLKLKDPLTAMAENGTVTKFTLFEFGTLQVNGTDVSSLTSDSSTSDILVALGKGVVFIDDSGVTLTNYALGYESTENGGKLTIWRTSLSQTIYWKGNETGDGGWTEENVWADGSTEELTTFQSQDRVELKDLGDDATRTITISGGNVLPSSVTVSGGKYVITGVEGEDYGIYGLGYVVVQNGAELTMSLANTYTGGTTVNAGGVLNITVTGALGTGTVALGGALNVGAGVTELANDLTDDSAGTAGSGVLTYAGDADSTLTLSGDRSGFTGTLRVDAGTVALENGTGTEVFGEIAIADGAELHVFGATQKSDGYLTETLENVSGAGTVVFDGGNNSPEDSRIFAGIYLSGTFTGTVELKDVNLAAADMSTTDLSNSLEGSAFGSAEKIVLNNAALNFTNTAAEFAKDIEIAAGATGYIRSYGGNEGVVLTGSISGTEGTLNVRDGGVTTFTGDIDVGAITVESGTTSFTGSSFNVVGDVSLAGTSAEISYDNAAVGGNLTATATAVNLSGSLTIGGNFERTTVGGGDGRETSLLDGASVSVTGNASFGNNESLTLGDNAVFSVNGTLSNYWGLSVNLGAGAVLDAETFQNTFDYDLDGRQSAFSGAGADSSVVRFGGIELGSYGIAEFDDVRVEIGAEGIASGGANSGLKTSGAVFAVLAGASGWSSDAAFTLTDGETTFETASDELIALSGNVSGEGTLVKTGAGTLTLSQVNANAGGTTVEAGTLAYALADGATVSGLSVEVGASGTLAFTGETAGTVTLGDGVSLNFADGGTLLVGARETVRIDSGASLNGDLIVESGGESSASKGVLSFAVETEMTGSLTLSGAKVSVEDEASLTVSVLNFENGGNATVTGDGLLLLNGGVTTDRGSYVIDVDRVGLTGDTEFSVASGATLTVRSSGSSSYGGAGTTLTKTGAGRLAFENSALDNFAGNVVVNAGTLASSSSLNEVVSLKVTGSGATFSGDVYRTDGAASVTVTNGARLNGDVDLSGGEGMSFTLTESAIVSGNVTLTGTSSADGERVSAEFGSATLSGNLTVENATLNFSGTLSGVQVLTWNDGNKVVLSDSFRKSISESATLIDFTSQTGLTDEALTAAFSDDEAHGRRQLRLVYNSSNTSLDVAATGALVWNTDVTLWESGNASNDDWDFTNDDGSAGKTFFMAEDYVEFRGSGSLAIKADEEIMTSGIVFDVGASGSFSLTANGDDGAALVDAVRTENAGLTVLSGIVSIADDVHNKLTGGTFVYGGQLVVSGADADALGGGKVVLGDAASPLADAALSLTFYNDDGPIGNTNIDNQFYIGNGRATINVGNSGTVTLSEAILRDSVTVIGEDGQVTSESAATTGLTKTGAGTLNIKRGSDLDSLTVSAGTVILSGAADTSFGIGDVSVASGATLTLENGSLVSGENARFGTITLSGGTLQVSGGLFNADAVSSTGGTLAGNMELARSQELKIDVSDGTLAFSGWISGGTGSVLEKSGAGTLTLASSSSSAAFSLETDFRQSGGTVNFSNRANVSGAYAVAANSSATILLGNAGNVSGGSLFSGDMTFEAGSQTTISFSQTSAAGEENGLTVTGDVSSGAGAVVSFTGADYSGYYVTLDAENVSFGKLAQSESEWIGGLSIGGRSSRLGTVHVTAESDTFSAGGIYIGAGSSLTLRGQGADGASAEAITVEADVVSGSNVHTATLDLSDGTTLNLSNDKGVSVLGGTGTLKILGGTLNVRGRNYSDSGPTIELNGATFNFEVTGDETAYSTLTAITTASGATGTVSKTGTGTLVLATESGDIAFDGTVALKEGVTELYSTMSSADVTVSADAELRFHGSAAAAGLAETLSGAGTLDVQGRLTTADMSKFAGFDGTVSASDYGEIVASDALNDWLNDGAAGTARTLAVKDDGWITAESEDVTLTKVALKSGGENSGHLAGVYGAVLTVGEVSADAGTALHLNGSGTLGALSFAGENEANSLVANYLADWTLDGAGTNISQVTLGIGSTLTVAHSGALADASVYMLDDATLTFDADGTYANTIAFIDTAQIAAAAGKAVSLTGTISESAVIDGYLALASETGATLTVGDSVLDLDYTRVYLGFDLETYEGTDGKIVVNVGSDKNLDGAVGTNYEGKVMLRGAGTAEFNVAEGATLSASDNLGEIGEFAVTGAGTVSFASGTMLAVAEGGAGTLSVAESATLELNGASLSDFTLTGAGAATISGGSLGGMRNAANVSLSSGTLTVSGDISGSAVAFTKTSAKLATSSSADAGISVSATVLSGETVTLVNAGGSVNYSSDSSFSGTASLVLEAAESGIIGGVVNAPYAGSLAKNGDGTWTVSDYTLGETSGESLTVSDAGTLIWENAKFGEYLESATVAIAKDATLRIVGLAEGDMLRGSVSGDGTLQIYGTGTAENPLTLDVNADAGSAWRLRVSGGSQVLITAALPGALLLEDSGTVAVVELSGSDETMAMTERLFISSGATLEKTGAGTLVIDASPSVHQVSGTVSVSEGEFVQRTNMTWSSGARLVVSGDGVFETDFSSETRLRNNAAVSGDGTLNFLKTGDAGYELYGDVSGFTGTAKIAENASLTLSGSLFDKAAHVDVAAGGELTLAVSSKTVGERALENFSGAGTLIIDTPRDSNIYTAVYDYDAGNTFSGIIYVRSGVFSMDTDGLSGLAAAKVVVGGDVAAGYNETRNASGILSGGFLRLVNDGESVYDATALLSGSSKFSLESTGGVIFAGGTHSVDGDFGTGGMFVTEAGSTLQISGSAEVSGGVFVAGSSVLAVNVPKQTRSVSESKAFAAASSSETGNVRIVGGDFTLNGTLRVYVDGSTDMDSALVDVVKVGDVGGNTVLDSSGTSAASIQIIGDVSGEELAGVTVLGGKNSQIGDLDDLVSVVTSGGETLSVARDENGSLVVVSSELDEYSPSSGLSELYSVLAGNPGSTLWKNYLKNDLANRELTAERLVKLSPVSFGALVEMQSGFAALENDLLRERLEQRRYERTFAADRGVQFKPFVNIVGSDREGDGDGTESANYDITHVGAVGGFDFSVSDNTIVGVSVGLDWAKADLHDGAGKHEADMSRIGVYGMSVFENAYFGWGLSAGAASFETKRHSGFNGETLSGDSDGNDVNASFLLGAGWTLDEALGIDVSPYVGLDIGYAYAKSFSEDGGSETALDVDRIDRWSLRGKIGATLNWRATDSLRIGIDAAFAHEFLDSDIDIDAKFASGDLAGSAFSSTAYLMDENTIQIGPRADFRISDTWSVSAAYTFETDLDDTTTHTANLGVRARF